MINFEGTRLIGYYYQNEPSNVTKVANDEDQTNDQLFEKRLYVYKVPMTVDRWAFIDLFNKNDTMEPLELSLDLPSDARLVGFEEVEVGIILILERVVFVQKPKNKRNLKVI